MLKTKILKATLLGGLFALSGHAFADSSYCNPLDPNSSCQENNNSYSNEYNNISYVDNTTISTQPKNIKIEITTKTKDNLKRTPFSSYDFIQKQAKKHGYKVLWLAPRTGLNVSQHTYYQDFYKDKKVNWKLKVSRALIDYNEALFHDASRGTEFKAYDCHNKKLIISDDLNSMRLSNTFKATDCKLLSYEEQIQYFVNDKEVKLQDLDKEVELEKEKLLKEE